MLFFSDGVEVAMAMMGTLNRDAGLNNLDIASRL